MGTALVRSAVATSVGAASAVLLVAHRDLARRPAEHGAGGAGGAAGTAGTGCPVLRALGRVPAQAAAAEPPDAAAAFPEYGV